MKPRVRTSRFRLEQLDRIMEIEAAVFPEESYNREMFLDLHHKCGELFFVARWAAEIAGYATSCLERGGGEIVSIAVDPRLRRHGIGRALMRQTLRALAVAGAEFVSLAVRESNAGAIAFYDSFGFERVRRVPDYYHDGEAAVRMKLRLHG
jgi:ribosomal-protein-alanine N-acetyltransferase